MNSNSEIRSKKLKELEALYVKGDMILVIPEAIKLIHEYSSGIAYNILALAYKRQGDYQKAKDLYEKLLVDNPKNTMFLSNLGNIYYDFGKVNEAEECYKKSLAIDPMQYNCVISLGNIYVSNLKFNDALFTFESLIQEFDNLTFQQLSDINYRIAEVYRKMGSAYFDNAITHYRLSNEPLSSAQLLECIYKTKDKSLYQEEEEKINASGEFNPLLAAVQVHASIRYGITDENLFCREPFKYIYHSKLTVEEGFNDDLVSELLNIKNNFESSPQPLIENGEQSSGNFLVSNDPSVQKIKSIIVERIINYQYQYKDFNEGFIKNWPKNIILHGWIIELKNGGSLGSHMHKQGWLSGSLYLNLQKDPGSRQGNIVFDLDGGSYPKNGKTFSHKEFNIEKGDIVLFPSSIFHKTVPFESQEHRVTLAFDVKPVFI